MDTQGRRIKKLRMENGFSQKKLADMVGIVTTHLQAYEYGTRHPKEEILDRLALALEVVPSMLQPLDVDTVEGLLGIIYEMHTSYHGLGDLISEEETATLPHIAYCSVGIVFRSACLTPCRLCRPRNLCLESSIFWIKAHATCLNRNISRRSNLPRTRRFCRIPVLP